MKEPDNIYDIHPIKRTDKRKVWIIIGIIFIMVCLIIIANNAIKVIQRHNIYEKYEAQLIAIQKAEQEEQLRIAQEKEKIRQLRLPKLSEQGKANIQNIYNSETKRAFLTFDDGPSSVTSIILDTLKQEDIKATFFVLGSRVNSMPEIVKRMYDEGHYIANHGFSHSYSSIYSSTQSILDEYNRCNDAIKNAIGEPEYNSHLFRFPGGSKGGPYSQIKAQAEQLLVQNEIVHVDWNALTGDSETRKPTPEYEMERLQTTVGDKNSVIILMHDAPEKKVTAETLPQIISYLRQQGYEFKNFYEIIK